MLNTMIFSIAASAPGFLTNIETFLKNIPGWLNGAVTALAVIMIAVGGIMILTGDQQKYAEGKQRILRVVIGVGIFLMATQIVSWISGWFAGN